MMKFLRSILCIFFCVFAHEGHVLAAQTPRQRLLIIDTDGHQSYYNRTLITLAQSVGFAVTYQTVYEFIEKQKIESYDAVFFLLGLSFAKNIHSDLGAKSIKILQDFNARGDKTVGLFLPSAHKFSAVLFDMSLEILQSLHVFNQAKTYKKDNSSALLARSFLHYILQPDVLHGFAYGTTLINPKSVIFPVITDSYGIEFKQTIDLESNEITATVLPRITNAAPLPKALYLKNSITKNCYFITKLSEFNFADIAENFFRAPLHIAQRGAQLKAAQQTLWELNQACVNNSMPSKIPLCPELPKILTVEHITDIKKNAEQRINTTLQKNKQYAWIAQEGLTVAWEAPTDYSLHEDATIHALQKEDAVKAHELKAEALRKGITFLYDADINLVWFEFNPETFLSPRGKYKNKKAEFIEQVKQIATEFKKIYCNKKLPKIFVGTDITTNFGLVLPKNPVADLWGETYNKIPSPLDVTDFWKPELLDVFDAYCTTLGSLLPIDGIFLDFEMYHAPEQAGSYTELMDFSDIPWRVFQSKHTTVPPLKTPQKRVDYLKNNALFARYFSTLEAAAMELGKTIKNHMRTLVPNILIAAYAPTLPSSWFYRGIMAGLSSAQEPLILTTFNTDFYSHYQWLQEHNIHVLHGAPVLLSKLDCQESFGLIDELTQYHYFVWFNRPSRMVYKNKTNQWWSVEASPLDTHTVAHGIRNSGAHKRKKRNRLKNNSQKQ